MSYLFKQKWYLQTWFIACVFAFSYFIVPFFIGVVLVILQYLDNKKRKQIWDQQGFGDLARVVKEKEKIQKQIVEDQQKSNQELNKITKQKELLSQEITELTKKKEAINQEVVVLEDELLMQSFGFYSPKYDFENSQQYKEKLEQIRELQKLRVKNEQATNHSNNWTLDGSRKKGEAMNKKNIKLVIRAFNNECDAAITKVKFNNIESIEKRIRNAYKTLNNLSKANKIEITAGYLELKLNELYLVYEYAQKKQEELEEQRRIREQMREEKRVQEELERKRKKIEKEASHFKQAIHQLQSQLYAADTQTRSDLMDQIREVEKRLQELEKQKENVLERELNTRAGYVYIISNIGSFGENVYKIGMTRRLEPMDRVKELGDASVPFTFDVHAMIFSEDAVSLEKALHQTFKHRRMNMVNGRKEFFRVSLAEIEKVVRENHNKTVEFTKLALAEEYRQTQKMLEELEMQHQQRVG